MSEEPRFVPLAFERLSSSEQAKRSLVFLEEMRERRSVHRAGLATLTHTPSPLGFLRGILERPENERPYVLIPVGYPAKGCVVPDLERKELGEILVRR